MNLSILNFLKRFIPFSIILFFLHFFVIEKFSSNYSFYYSIYTIYLFHIITTALVCFIIIYINEKLAEKTGFAFMALSILKMLAAILFLIPLIRIDKDQKLPDIFAFFIPYFAFLFFELTFIIKLLNRFKKK
jgi:Family of unknown function (DUF6168)